MAFLLQKIFWKAETFSVYEFEHSIHSTGFTNGGGNDMFQHEMLKSLFP